MHIGHDSTLHNSNLHNSTSHNSISPTGIAAAGAASAQHQHTTSFADAMFAAQPEANDTSTSQTLMLDSHHGRVALDIDAYFTAPPQAGPVDLMSIPLLLPSEHNINALSSYSEDAFRELLAAYDIATPPANIEFDGEGKLVLPDDYPHAHELRQALDENPGVEKALQTLSALANHYAGIMEGTAFRDEMATARNRADQDRIVQKYAHLFDDNRPGVQIVLSFLNDGSLLVGEKGGDAITQTRQA